MRIIVLRDYPDSQIAGAILSSLPDIKFWSRDALRKLYFHLINLYVENLRQKRMLVEGGGEKGVLIRKINQLNNRKKCTPRSRILLLQTLFEFTLSMEGKSLFNQFGFSNQFGDRLSGNPEVQSIYNLQPLITKEV